MVQATKSSALFQEICWEEPEKQKTRSCRAQELSRSCAQWRGQERRQWTTHVCRFIETTQAAGEARHDNLMVQLVLAGTVSGQIAEREVRWIGQ